MKKRKFRIRHIIFAVAVFFIGYTLVNQQIMIINKKNELSQKKEQYQKIVDDNALLKDKIEYAKTPEYRERIARERVGLAKPGDIVYIIDEKK